MEKKSPHNGPLIINCQPGKYDWCSCGHSNRQPYCDGSHVDTKFEPVVVEIFEEKKLAWCGCKHTSNPPFCDGSHGKLSK